MAGCARWVACGSSMADLLLSTAKALAESGGEMHVNALQKLRVQM